jgi:hypothetical protein
MRRLGFGLLFGVGGALVAAVLSYALIWQFSGNTHDRELEAAMTSAFFFAPLGLVGGAIAGALLVGRWRGDDSAKHSSSI